MGTDQLAETEWNGMSGTALWENCFNKVQVGVLLPSDNVAADYDHARCVGAQKLVGW